MSLQTIREDEVTWSLADSVSRIVHGKLILLASTLLGLLFGIAIAFLIKPYFYSESVFLPPAGDATAASSASLIFGGGGGFGGDSADTYLGLLSSRTVADDVIDHLGLMQVFHVGSREYTHYLLFRASNFSVNKNSLIHVSVKEDDPKLAADIANAYLEALYRTSGRMADEASAHRSSFLDAQLQQQRNLLTKAEDELRQTQEQTGVVLPGGEAQAGVAASAQLQGAIGGAEARLAGLLVNETDQNPDVVQARTLLSQLRGQLARQQATESTGGSAGITPNRKLPGLTLLTERRQRDVRMAETAYGALLAQADRARLSSIDPGPQLKIVDTAIPAEHKAGPNRPYIAAGGAAAGFACGLAFLLLHAPVRRLTRTLYQAVNESRDGRR